MPVVEIFLRNNTLGLTTIQQKYCADQVLFYLSQSLVRYFTGNVQNTNWTHAVRDKQHVDIVKTIELVNLR